MKTTMYCLFFVLAAAGSVARADAPDRAARARAFVEAVNAADVEACEAFFGLHRTKAFDDESRASYERVVAEFGRLSLEDLVVDGNEARARCRATGFGEPVLIRFVYEDAPPHRIESIGLEVGGGDGPPEPTWDGPEIGPDAGAATIRRVLDAWLDERAREDEFSGVVVLTRDGETLYEGAVGLADRVRAIANTPDTRFRVGSITKAFTRVAAARLVQEGRLSPRSTVAELLPDYPRLDIGGAITVDQLLSHRSGLGGMNYDAYLRMHGPSVRRPMDYVALFADEPLLFAPGEGEEYSNAGYILLGAILEAVTGEPFERVIEQSVFEPAGMEGSCFVALDRPEVEVATGYWHCDPARPEFWCVNTFRQEVVATASGGSYSTAMDLVRFARALRDGRLLAPGYVRWYYTGEWPEPGGGTGAGPWPVNGIAGGSEGVSGVLIASDRAAVSVLGNLDEPSAELVGAAIARAIGMIGR